MEEHELRWVAPEYEFREKSSSWFWMSIIIAIVLIFLAIWQQNYLFALILVFSEILVIIWGNREPRLVNFLLTNRYLLVDDRYKYHFTEMEHWSVEEVDHKHMANILIHFKHAFHIGLRIHIPKQMLPRFRKIVRFEVEELHRKEKFSDVLEEFLGF